MKIQFHQKNLSLSDKQEGYVESKLNSLNIFKVLEDPSVMAKVEVELLEKVVENNSMQMKVNLSVPGSFLRAETYCNSVEEGIDLIENKLRMQLEKYKTTR